MKVHHGFVHGMERFNYQYMSDYYPGSIEYDLKKIKIFTIDIEVACEKGFLILQMHPKKYFVSQSKIITMVKL